MPSINTSPIFVSLDENFAGGLSDESVRLFHGRGHCYDTLEFINIDWIAPTILITLYKAVPQQDWEHFIQQLKKHSIVNIAENIVVQHRYNRNNSFEAIMGVLPDQALAHESNLQYLLDFSGKQNIGFFFDMKPGRDWIIHHAQGKKVLNLFSYTCGFSVAALAGGANQIVNIDMSRSALAIGKNNHRLNNQQDSLSKVTFLAHNIFKSWGKLKKLGPFDIIIIDPPSNQKGSFIAEKDYSKIIKRLPDLAQKPCQILACLNSPHLDETFLNEQVKTLDSNNLVHKGRVKNRADFPEKDSSRNLKMMWYELK